MIVNYQKEIISFLLNSKKKNRLSHAYLFSGVKGIGKLDVALYFTCMLWCEEEQPCLKCKTCRDIMNKQFLNLYYLSSNKKIISVDDIYKLQKEFSLTPMLNGPRVYIIEDADKMSSDVQNKLLKFIEEPFDNTYAILLTTKTDHIIPTIKSRVISYELTPLSYTYLVDNLLTHGIDIKYAKLAAHLENSIDNCLNLLLDQTSVLLFDLVYKFINQIDDITLFFKENDFLSEQKNLINFIKLISVLYSDVQRANFSLETTTFNKEDLSKFFTCYESENISKIIEELVELEHKILYNGNINLNIVKLISLLVNT